MTRNDAAAYRAAVLEVLYELPPDATASHDTFHRFGRRDLLHLTGDASPWDVSAMEGGAILIAEIARSGRLGLGTSVLAEAFTLAPLLVTHGTDAQRHEFLHPMLRGEAVGCIAITEPSGGSNLLHAIETRARRVGDGWELSGEKLFITNGPVADFALVLARTSDTSSLLGFTLFAVDMSTPGITVVDDLDKIGMSDSSTGHLRFDGVQLSNSAVVGRVERGYVHAVTVLTSERVLTAVAAVELVDQLVTNTLARGHGGAHLDAVRGEVRLHRAFLRSVVREAGSSAPGQRPANLAKVRCVAFAQESFRRLAGIVTTGPEGAWAEGVRQDMRVISVFAGSSETLMESLSADALRTARSNSRAARV